MKPKFIRRIAASSAAIFVCASNAVRADQTWTGATNALWTEAGNWNSAVPGATDVAIFNSTSLSNLTIDTVASQAVAGIAVTSPAGPVTISNNTLTIGAAGIDLSTASQNLTLGGAVNTATSAAQQWSVGSGRLLTVVGSLGLGTFGPVNFNTTAGGTVQITTATASSLLFSRGFTLNNGDFAGVDGSNTVVGGSTLGVYTPNPNTGANLPSTSGTPVVIDVVNSNTNGTSAYRLSNNLTTSARFNTPHAAGQNWAVDINSRNHYLNDEFSILVGPAVNTNVVYNASSGSLRSNTAGITDVYLTNFSSSNLIFNTSFTEAGGRSYRLSKNGSGDVIFAGGVTATTGISINQGSAQIGNGGTTGSYTGGAIQISPGASLDFNRSDAALSVAATINGEGSVNQVGAGTVTLAGTNNYSGGTNITSGLIGASAINNFGSGPIVLNGGGVRFAADFDLTAANVSIGSAGATLDTNGNAVSLFNAFASGSSGSLTKIGAGVLTMDGNNDYSGGTTVNGGTLLANAVTAPTGSGTVTVNSGATLGGSGTISGPVVVTSGANLAPGTSVGTLTVGNLDLDAGSTATYEFNAGPANDRVAVSTTGGLTIDGGVITLVQEGTATAFNTPGIYNLISYSGPINGAGHASLSVANPQPGFSYVFGATGSNVTLTIATTGVVTSWTTNGSGSWSTGGDWSGTIPNAVGATAIFNTVLTNPATVTLDGSRTVGALTFLSAANGYTLAQGSGGSLIFNNGSNGDGAIANNGGTHGISAPITLISDLVLTSATAADNITLGGVISGAGRLTQAGPGSLSLLGTNDFTGDLTLSGGTTTFASGGLGGGDLIISGASLVWATSNAQDISNRLVTFGANPVTFDTNGNDVSLANSIGQGGAASFTKAGLGRLTLGANATFTGSITIADGILQLGTGGTGGMVAGSIINNGQLAISRSNLVILTNLISGTGSLSHLGSSELQLAAANSFSGVTTITSGAGSITLLDPLGLQNSTLNYTSPGGTLSFGTLTTATLGGLSGNRNLVLENVDPAAVALTIGNNGQDTLYSGILSGSGSLIKTGAGIMTLQGASSHTGATTVSGGDLNLALGGSLTNAILTVNGSGRMVVSGGTLSAASSTLAVGSRGFNMSDGEATFAATLSAVGGTGGPSSALIKVEGGVLNATSIQLGRTGENATEANADRNLYITGGVVNLSGNLLVGTGSNQPNSTVVTRIDGGVLNVAGAISVGLNNAGRTSILAVNGGELVNTGSGVNSGIVLGGPWVGQAAFHIQGGTATVERIQFGQEAINGAGLIRITSGELYIGSEGIVIGSSGVYTPEIRLTGNISGGGILGAKADWSTSLPVNVSGSGQSTVKAANASDTPFDITLTGALTGTGGLIKGGGGKLTLSGGNSYEGDTTVLAGILSIAVANLSNDATIGLTTGSKLNLGFSGGDLVTGLTINDTVQAPGIYGAEGSGAQFEIPEITGPGLLYVGTPLPPSGFGAWATLKGLTGAPGFENGATDDPDNDGIGNLLEFVLGGNPLASDPGILPDLELSPTHFVFTFHREDDSEAEATLAFQYGSNLVGWTNLVIRADTAASGTGVVVNEGTPAEEPDIITVTIPKTGTELFGRLRAVK